MKRFKPRAVSMGKFLLIATLVLAVTALSSGWSITCAQQDPSQPLTAVEKAAQAKTKADAAAHARQKRDEAVKRRQQTREYIQKAVEGQKQLGVTAPAGGKQ